MSYILDALRKADAQRESDPARGIHAQPMQAAPAAARAHRPAAWLAGGVLLLAGAAAVLFQFRDHAAAPAGLQTPVAAARPAPAGAGAPAAATAKLPPPTEVAVAATPVLPVAATPEPPAAKPAVADAIVPAAPPMPPRPAAPPRLPQQRAAPAATQPAPAMPAVAPVQVAAAPAPAPAPLKEAPAAAAARILAFHELPADVQRELPKLKITGGVHSENATQRLLIVGGEVTKEGAQLAPGLVLEQIRPKSAVFSFRGYRYSLIY